MENVQVQLTQVQKQTSPEVPLESLAKEVQPEAQLEPTTKENIPAATVDMAALIATLQAMQHGMQQTMQQDRQHMQQDMAQTMQDAMSALQTNVQTGVKVPVLPSKYMIKTQEEIIVENQGGYTKATHGDGFTVDWIARVKEEIELKPASSGRRGGVSCRCSAMHPG
jgi:hypothetical protein